MKQNTKDGNKKKKKKKAERFWVPDDITVPQN